MSLSIGSINIADTRIQGVTLRPIVGGLNSARNGPLRGGDCVAHLQ